MDQGSTSRAQSFGHAAPPQVLAHERGFAILFALAFFVLWSLPLWGPLIMPSLMAVVVLGYCCYWTAQALYSAAMALRSYRRMGRWEAIDWRARYAAAGGSVQQIVVLPNYGERLEKLRATLESLARSDYPREQLNVVLAMEERDEGALAKGQQLRDEFAAHFNNCWVTLHPLLPGETAGKASNLSSALRSVKKKCDELQWDSARVLVTTIDADARLHPRYLAALAVQFLSSAAPVREFYQGVLLLLNNIWDVHAPIRVLSAFWTFTYVTGVSHYQRMTVAVYSASLRLLEDIGYWDPRIVAEDGHVFFRAFFATQGTVNVRPIYLPVGLDVVQSPRLRDALRKQYNQMMRWAWTVSNLPFIAAQWVRHPEIPLRRKLAKCLPYAEGLLLIPSSWFVITFGVVLPPLINPAVQTSVFGWPLATLAPLVLTPSALSFVVALTLNLRLRQKYGPAHPSFSWRVRAGHAAEWLLLLFGAVFYFGVPYAQVYWRLLWGNDLPFMRTDK